MIVELSEPERQSIIFRKVYWNHTIEKMERKKLRKDRKMFKKNF